MRYGAGYTSAVEKTNRTLPLLCHLSPLVLLLPVPMANVLAPLIVWFIAKQQSTGADEHGRAVLNFQLSMTLYFAVMYALGALSFLEVASAVALRVWMYTNIFFILRGTYDASKGDLFKYPFSIRMIGQ